MDLQLTGKTALVTGGTRGIGRAIVETFLAEGANVAFCARSAEQVAEAEEFLSAVGPRVEGTAVDMGDAVAVARWVDGVAERFTGIDAVVSNVSALAIDDSDAGWQASLEVDLHLRTLRNGEVSAHCVHGRPGFPAGGSGHPGQYRVAREHLSRRRSVAEHRGQQP